MEFFRTFHSFAFSVKPSAGIPPHLRLKEEGQWLIVVSSNAARLVLLVLDSSNSNAAMEDVQVISNFIYCSWKERPLSFGQKIGTKRLRRWSFNSEKIEKAMREGGNDGVVQELISDGKSHGPLWFIGRHTKFAKVSNNVLS
ncbi:hypothetical protein OROMI_009349 [Orobanche minor]